VYTLKLEQGRYYVGWTQSLEVRIAQHFLGRGADWTRLFKPLEVIAVSQGGQDLEEAQTIAMMARYGWRFVRGGKHTSPALVSQPKPLGIVLARGVPSKVPKPAFLEEVALVGGHSLRTFQTLEGEIFGALAGPICREGRQFAGDGMEDIRAKAGAWLRGRKLRREDRFWNAGVGIFGMFRRGRWSDDGLWLGVEVKEFNEFRFSRLSDY
jgi:hypothetical protein